jgi:hypothetical protein
MKLRVWAVLLPTIISFACAQGGGGGPASYSAVTTVTPGGNRPTNTFEPPPLPTQTTPAAPPNSGSYKLNSSFKITDTPVTRTFNWTIR